MLQEEKQINTILIPDESAHHQGKSGLSGDQFPSELSENIQISVILPAFTEAPALPKVLDDLTNALEGCYEIIVVDDGSIDNTAEIACSHPCRLVRHLVNQGKGAAVRTGLSHALLDAFTLNCLVPSQLIFAIVSYNIY